MSLAIDGFRMLLTLRLQQISFVFLVVVLEATCSIGQETHWPQFRGPGARGVATDGTAPVIWSSTRNVAWKTDIPGRGWSSPIVWGNRVFLTSVINQGTSEDPKKGLYFGGERPDPPTSDHQWIVVCLDLQSGDLLWQRQVYTGKPQSSIHLKNTFASETPATDGQRVYCLFGNVGLFCLDFAGNVLWKHELKPHRTRYGWGTAASPVLFRNQIYLTNDNEEASYLLAIDKHSGRELWRTPRDEKSNWSTPYVWTNTLRTEIVTTGTGKVRSYDLHGKLLWTLEGMSSITIATPFSENDLLYISSGYVMDRLKPIYAIRPGGVGDISLQDNQSSNQWIAWSQDKAAPYNPSTLLYRDQLYVLYDRGLVASFDPRDGSNIFGPERLPKGRAFTASPWAYDGKVFLLNEDGVTTVIQAGPEFKVLHTNALAEDDMCMATPAIAGRSLLIRTLQRLYCVRADGRRQ